MDGGNMIGFDVYAVSHANILADEWRDDQKLDRMLASDPTERIKQCIAFLFRIERIEVADTVKNTQGDTSYVVNVIISDASDKSEATTASFQMQRTFKEFKELHHLADHWSDKHPYGKCTYCAFFQGTKLPGALSRLTKSKEKMEAQLQEFLFQYVFHARLPRPSEKECQGFDHIPSILTRFLTKDLPPVKDATGEEQQQEQQQKEAAAAGAVGGSAKADGA